ncbi:MBL fold metallo-hydrolase [Massilia sp. YIM B02443]|uniref:MBL fold metallo-hydrolase n=1 Tax=Massilia sp. YIM B02443 TaxID=3050127 RepID=UPI0025B6E732|nr:MBL fold metallo-hydrolase [Massilia sp. YIM B02443]MDN4039816.1 MBL fold metallo-hydrolase [Massilia sp. YIM B02443]
MKKTVARHALACTLAGILITGAAGAFERTDASAVPTAQAPGYFRMPLGRLTVTALYDGAVDIDPGLLAGASRQTIRSSLAQAFLPTAAPVQTAVNAFLVDTGDNRILVDTGTAKLFGPRLGFILDNLRAAGYRATDIDTILLTHLHPDHAGGLLAPDGSMAFPNARVFVPKTDADYWLSEAAERHARPDQRALFKMSRDAVAPYRAAGRLTLFEAGQPLPGGVSAITAPGHTPGHTAYLFPSGEGDLLVWGDIIHNAAVQFPHPKVSIEFDSDRQQAVATRHQLLSYAGKRGVWVASAHIPFPGIGRVGVDKPSVYRWVPAEYR